MKRLNRFEKAKWFIAQGKVKFLGGIRSDIYEIEGFVTETVIVHSPTDITCSCRHFGFKNECSHILAIREFSKTIIDKLFRL